MPDGEKGGGGNESTRSEEVRRIDTPEFQRRSASWLASWREEGFPWRKALIAILVLGIFAGLVYALRTVLTPIVLSLAFAYVLDPVVDRLQSWAGRHRILGWIFGTRIRAIGVLLVALFVGFGGFVAALFPLFNSQIKQIGTRLPEYQQSLALVFETKVRPWLAQTLDWDLPATGGELWTELTTRISSGGAGAGLTNWLAGVGQWFAGNLLTALLTLVNILLIPVFTFYLLRDWDNMVSKVGGLVPQQWRPSVAARFQEVDTVLGEFLRGQLSVCLILAVLYSIGLWWVGCPMWLVVGLLAGLGFLVPYLGTAIGIVLGCTLTLFHYGLAPSVWTIPLVGTTFSIDVPVIGWRVVHVALVFAVVQLVESNLITPKIVGEKVGLHPVVVIVAIIAGAELLGFLGMLLAVPFTAAAAVFVRWSLQAYRESSFYRTGTV